MRIEVIAEIKTNFVITDNGYTSNMTLPEIEEWAKSRLECVQVHIKEGGLNPKHVRADIKLERLVFTPET